MGLAPLQATDLPADPLLDPTCPPASRRLRQTLSSGSAPTAATGSARPLPGTRRPCGANDDRVRRVGDKRNTGHTENTQEDTGPGCFSPSLSFFRVFRE